MVLRVKGLSKSYPQGDGTCLHVLKGLNIDVAPKQTIAVMGESGSGKTTFLNCITGLDKYNSGSVLVCDKEINKLGDKKLSELRNRNIGFVFQFHYLLKDFSVKENVMMPCLIAGISAGSAEKKTLDILKKIKLLDKANNFPRQLSGGEQQRVAIARALVMKPDMLVMDEPTGNLDEKLTEEVISYVVSLCRENGISIIVATHNRNVAKQMDKTYLLSDGFLKEAQNG